VWWSSPTKGEDDGHRNWQNGSGRWALGTLNGEVKECGGAH
jgi:hypothetical protein